MQLITIFVLLLPLLTNAHNITHILAKHPEFSTFSHYLTTTRLADEINRRRTITVCAIDNSAMDDLLSHHFSLSTLKNLLSLHVFADYFGSKKLHQISKGSTTTSSLYQATGEAAGTSGYVNITDFKSTEKVGFSPINTDSSDLPMATFVKSIEELPYTISVIQISNALTSPEAESPTASPTDLNLVSIMAKQGCLSFSELISSQSGVEDAFTNSVESGLTIFCPSDSILKSFMPRFRNLTELGKSSLLLYHGVPEYNSLGMLRSSNGLMNSLAEKYDDFTVRSDGGSGEVKIETRVVTAKIKGTLIDDDPLVIYKIDRVLLPRELFKAAPAEMRGLDSDAGAPEAAEDEDSAAADENSNDGNRMYSGGAFVSLFVGVLILIF